MGLACSPDLGLMERPWDPKVQYPGTMGLWDGMDMRDLACSPDLALMCPWDPKMYPRPGTDVIGQLG